MTAAEQHPRTPLVLVRGDATEEEVAALMTVMQGLSVGSPAAEHERVAVSEWGAPHRQLRASYSAGPGGWRSSGLPR